MLGANCKKKKARLLFIFNDEKLCLSSLKIDLLLVTLESESIKIIIFYSLYCIFSQGFA